MRVKTIRQHINGFPPQAVKNPGRKYDAPDNVAAALIEDGVVEPDTNADG